MRQRRGITPQSSGPMADIAFLLLVFFLLVSTLEVDHGLATQLEKPMQNVNKEKIVQSQLLLNKSGLLICNGEMVQSETLESQLSRVYSTEPKVKNVLMFRCEREVDYITFVTTLDRVKSSFHLFRDEMAKQIFSTSWDLLKPEQQAQIIQDHPLVLAEDVVN